MTTINLEVSHLKAALICAANKDIRYYLNGVLVDIRKRDALIVSTDGHRLCLIRSAVVADGEPDNVPAQIIIPRDVLKGIKPMRGAVQCVLEYDPAQPMAECKLSALADGERTFEPVDGKFPDWSRVVPEKLTGDRAAFNPFYVADFLDVVRLVSGNGNAFTSLHENGKGSAVITSASAPEFLGVLMPMLGDDSEYTRPEWLDEPRELVQHAEAEAARPHD